MEIRSVTLFAEPDLPPARAAAFFEATRQAFSVPVQTTRLALPPFPDWWDLDQSTGPQAQALARHGHESAAGYVALGPVRLGHDAGWLNLIPEIIAASETLFLSAEVADQDGHIDLGRTQAVAEIVRRVSALQNGFGNLYLAATANCGPGIPFFPVAYHHGGAPYFALALEAADLAVEAVAAASSLEEARTLLQTAVEERAAHLSNTAARLAADHDIPFAGLDFTLAPFPAPGRNLGEALEGLGLANVGSPGTLFAVAFLAEAIAQADFPRCGFSGLFFPVLEDTILAQRTAESRLSLPDLLSYAAVCGAGVDLLPLPGDIDVSELTGTLLDVAALALRLDKPLTARLMPLPGRKPGDLVHFDFPYFAESRVTQLAGGVRGLLARPESIALARYHRQQE